MWWRKWCLGQAVPIDEPALREAALNRAAWSKETTSPPTRSWRSPARASRSASTTLWNRPAVSQRAAPPHRRWIRPRSLCEESRGIDDESAAVQQAAPQLKGRDVERDRRQLGGLLVPRRRCPRPDVSLPVAARTPLRGTQTGGLHDVGEVLGPPWVDRPSVAPRAARAPRQDPEPSAARRQVQRRTGVRHDDGHRLSSTNWPKRSAGWSGSSGTSRPRRLRCPVHRPRCRPTDTGRARRHLAVDLHLQQVGDWFACSLFSSA